MTNHNRSADNRSPRRRVGEVLTAASTAVILAIGLAACSSAEGKGNTNPTQNDPKATHKVESPAPTTKPEDSPEFWSKINMNIVTPKAMPAELQPLANMSPDEYYASSTRDQKLNYLDAIYNREAMNNLINKHFTTNGFMDERVELTADSTAKQVWDDFNTSKMLLLSLTEKPTSDTANKVCGPLDDDNVNKAAASFTDFFGNTEETQSSNYTKTAILAEGMSAQNNLGAGLALCPTLVIASGIYANQKLDIVSSEKTTTALHEGGEYTAYTYTYTDGNQGGATFMTTLVNVPYKALDGTTKYHAVQTSVGPVNQ